MKKVSSMKYSTLSHKVDDRRVKCKEFTNNYFIYYIVQCAKYGISAAFVTLACNWRAILLSPFSVAITVPFDFCCNQRAIAEPYFFFASVVPDMCMQYTCHKQVCNMYAILCDANSMPQILLQLLCHSLDSTFRCNCCAIHISLQLVCHSILMYFACNQRATVYYTIWCNQVKLFRIV